MMPGGTCVIGRRSCPSQAASDPVTQPLAEARAWFEEARPLYRELGNRGSLVVTVLTPLSTTALRQGDLPAAERCAMEALETSSGTGWEASALVLYGEALAARGDLDAADAATARALGLRLVPAWRTGSGWQYATSPGSPRPRRDGSCGAAPRRITRLEERCRASWVAIGSSGSSTGGSA